MTALLQQAISAVEKLSDPVQDWVGERILAELAADQRWEELFARSQDELGALADDALAAFHAGQGISFEDGLRDHHEGSSPRPQLTSA
jgi:hypothetical protein